ncbi:quinon protein alcohol dehydrogenase-like superfamily [Dactylonectria estremocensis]|uniref:Mitochondrial division protein 1 n=1 Tax=Dactylonectria estremocensis TaxID=1079267 RepID=A0A9P9DPN5_9HYPO|nr:quinon protein alcohol dehydrogenase-like superfamily [Dactylonectria estremocensis]
MVSTVVEQTLQLMPVAHKVQCSHGGQREKCDQRQHALPSLFERRSASDRSVAFSPDGQRLASASSDKTIKVWDTTTGRCEATLEGHGDRIHSVAFSPDSQRLASASGGKTVKIWDTTTGRCEATLEGHGSWVDSVAFSPDGQRLASASWEKTVKIWDAMTGRCEATLEGHGNSVYSVAFSPDGQRLASASTDDTVKIWDTTTGHCEATLEGHGDRIHSVAFSPDSHHLASASWEKTVKIWDTTTGHCEATLEGHGDRIHSVAFSPDSQRLASASSDKTVKIWDTTTGYCEATLEGHGDWVHLVAFSLDGQRLVSASHDNTIKVWDATTGCCQTTLEGHSDAVEPGPHRVASTFERKPPPPVDRYVTGELEPKPIQDQAAVPRQKPDNASPMPECLDSGYMESNVESPTPKVEDHDPDSSYIDSDVDDDSTALSSEEELDAILGAEYTHLAQPLVIGDTPSSTWDTPADASPSSGTSGRASSPNMPSSHPGGQKRKSPRTGGGGGPDENEANDGDGDENRPPKRATKAQSARGQRYDCPIFRGAISAKESLQTSRGSACAPGGLDLRNLLVHMRRVHLRCEKCEKQFGCTAAAATHLLNRDREDKTCQQRAGKRRCDEIDIELWLEIEEVYKRKDLDEHQKWQEWHRLLYPEAGNTAIDGRHHGNISFSTADIPRLLRELREKWKGTPSLQVLSDEQLQAMTTEVDKMLRRMRVAPQARKPRMSQPEQGQNAPGGTEFAGNTPAPDLSNMPPQTPFDLLSMAPQAPTPNPTGVYSQVGLPDVPPQNPHGLYTDENNLMQNPGAALQPHESSMQGGPLIVWSEEMQQFLFLSTVGPANFDPNSSSHRRGLSTTEFPTTELPTAGFLNPNPDQDAEHPENPAPNQAPLFPWASNPNYAGGHNGSN